MMRKIYRYFVGVMCVALLAFGSSAWAQASALAPLLNQGDEQWATGKIDLAQKTFEQAVTLHPRSVAARMKLGGLQLSRQNFKAATETYKEAISLDAHNAKAWLGLGFSYLHMDRNDLSLAVFNEAIRVEPSYKERLAPVMAKLALP
ncbi:tetratricopeptide repeat protein [Rhodoferax sp.]|uniref:tetratricopeptide repeat protein n=1 Tax=Rhodoferax sp. TaxID=50421 RepID=UPI0025CFE10C|nr:tetratricopeptide repeat protein [Rhodoferax sp.]MCM2295680.1 tetratricopeptide repeat protein [Rhodoferax sp.]